MDDAVETVSEIIATCIGAFDDVEDVETRILAAIQADPLAYVKPKPLVWDGIFARVIFGGNYQILESQTGKSHCLQVVYKNYSHTVGYFPTLEAAQAAAYDDLCKRVKELF